MRLDRIINNPNRRLKHVLETLKSEFGIEIDFNDKKSLSDLKTAAQDTAKTVKTNESFNSQHKNPKVVCSYLILEAIKLHSDTSKERIMTEKMSKKMPAKKKKMVKEGNEIDKAELLLASKNIVDDLQSMIEDLSKTMVQKLPPIIDRIKIEYGLGQGANYREQATAALQSVMDAVNGAKESIDNLTMGLSGDVDMASGMDQPELPSPMQEPEVPAPGAEEAPAEEPGMEVPAEEPESTNPEGRERKESKQIKGIALREDLELAAKTVRKLVKHDKMDFNRAMDKVKKSIVGKDEDMGKVRNRANELLGEGEEAGQNMGEKIPAELKVWHVQVKSPATNKLFGNFRVFGGTPDIAKKTAQNAVMQKHGMTEWNDEYEFTIKPMKEDVVDFPQKFKDSFKGLQQEKKPTFGKKAVKDKVVHMRTGQAVDENASGGATGAGAVASIPKPLFKKPLSRVSEKAKLGSGARFAKVEKSAEKSGAKNPAAVAAAAGIKKYGVKKMEKMAHHESASPMMKPSRPMSKKEQEVLDKAKKEKVKEDSNSSQTITAQNKPQNSMFGQPAPTQTYNQPPEQANTPAKQPHAPAMLAQGSQAMSGGKKVTVDSDNGTMVGIKDSDNGPVRMVPKTSVQAVAPLQSIADPKIDTAKVESVTESKKMDPKHRAQRINRRALKRYDHSDFIDLIHANLGREHAEVAEDCLHGCDFNDHHPDHLNNIADFAKKKGEHNLSYDIKTHFLPKVTVPMTHAVPHAPVHPDQAAVVNAPMESATKPYKLVVETTSGKKGKKTFTNEAAAKQWLASNGHHFKSVKVDV